MNKNLQNINELIQSNGSLSAEQKEALLRSLKDADKEFEIVSFKLDRTEKVKRTTAILLEETIAELEEKRKTVEESKDALQKSLEELRAAQTQLIHSEKMASLGELTAGIAHEIQNPLNFVNNFSDVSNELLEEMKTELEKGNLPDAVAIAEDVKQNLAKILHHGKRADGIVKSMLQHSRGGSGKKEPADLNTLVKEFANLVFHGMRAGKNPINVDIALDLDDSVGNVPVIAEDFSRVIINMCQNAFDAMREKQMSEVGNQESTPYLPRLVVKTRRDGEKVMLAVEDNGPGIPDDIRDKILQPFFTTKKGTQGTGLGLSITNDIVQAHGGEMRVESNENGGAKFVIVLPG